MKASLTAIAAALACTHFLWADLKVHWPLDESSGALASDSSGEGNDGIWLGSSGSVGWQPTGGIDGGAVSFSGSNRDSFITSSFDSVSGTPFTMSVWVKTTSIANDTMIYLGDAATGNSYNTLKIQGGSARVVVRNTSETQATGPSVRNGQWRHVLGVYNGTDDREIYVDGSLANSNFTDVSDVTLTRFGIGGLTRSTPAAPVDLFTGELDEVALWDRAFDAGDVAALHGLVTLGAGNSADLEAFMVAFSAQSTVGVRGVDWEYVTGLSGGVGTMAGSVSGGDASIVLGGSGQGMRMVGAAAPMITSFTADHEAIASGVPVTLSWQIFNADSATISGVGSVDESGGSVVVSPTTTTTYTLNGLNGDGSDSSAVTITVTGATVDPEIGEFLAKNDTGLQDEDGARSDWIEIHNDSGFALDLAGYKLTNDALLLPMWSFPSRIMGVDERLVVFASSKDRTGAELHTNFTIDADGSYLALVRPNGTTIVQEFSPGYPPQSTDVSYSAEGFYATPTPGEENGPAASGGVLKNKVTFVTPGGLFFGGTVSLALTHPDGAAIIRYTTDGSTPDESSTAYASPISITSTTQVQAGVFRSDFVPGPISQEGYLFANSSLSSFDSDLPILVIDTFNTTLERNDSTFKDAVFTAFEPAVGTGRVALSDMPSVSGNSGIHVRGESSQLGGFNKLNFAFETRNSERDDKDVALFGMPAGSDWALHASEIDRTFIREQLPHRLFREIGRYSPRTRPVEVFLNQGGGEITQDDYRGVYILIERIRRGNDRVDISKLESTENTEPDITGGFIFKKDKSDPGDVRVSTPNEGNFTIVYPNENSVTTAQKDYLQDYLRDFETALDGASFADPLTGYEAYIDVPSWIDMHVIQELTKEVDSYVFSTFYHKDKDGKIVNGPLWDFDRSFGNTQASGEEDPEGWRGGPIGGRGAFWERLFEDPDFMQLYIDRWQELMETTLSEPFVNTIIDEMAAEVDEAKDRNFAPTGPWPLANVTRSHLTFPTYDQHVDYLRDWIGDRLDWVATEFTAKPNFSTPPGEYGGPFNLSLVTSGGTIYYTTDGSDPRASGDGISGTSYSGAIPISETTAVTARVLSGGEWSGPLSGSFIIGEPAAAGSLVISEIMYHPTLSSEAEITAGFTDEEQFEYLELMNIGASPIELADVVVSDVFDFTFGVLELAPGQRVLLVKNIAAFEFRYGSGKLIAGEYGAQSLKNSGERILMTAADGLVIQDFSYSDIDPWPMAADGSGASLLLINAAGNPDSGQPVNWTSGVASPGDSGGSSPFTGGDLLAYATSSYSGDGNVFSFVINPAAESVAYQVEVSDDLENWSSDPSEVEYLGEVAGERRFQATGLAVPKRFMRLRVQD